MNVKITEQSRTLQNGSTVMTLNASSPTTWKGANFYTDISNAVITVDTADLTEKLDRDMAISSTVTLTERDGNGRGLLQHNTLKGECRLASDYDNNELNCTYEIIPDNSQKKVVGTHLRIDLSFDKINSDNKINRTAQN
jgi:hypothetical protein